MSENRIEFEMSAREVRTAYAALCDQHIVGSELRETKDRITGRLMARLQNDAWLAEGRGIFDFEEEDAEAFVALLQHEPGASAELAQVLRERILFGESSSPAM